MHKLIDKIRKLDIEAEGIEIKLMPHQKQAREFILEREKDPNIRGGFLGMEPGMGKTLTMLSHLADEKDYKAPCLVVCPKTAMFTWKGEIEKFYPSKLKVLLFRKDQTKVENLTKEILFNYDIVITNYEFVRSLVNKYNLDEKIIIRDGKNRCIGINIPSRPLLEGKEGERLLFSVHWSRIICDESHNFSNQKTATFKSIMCLSGHFRWCLSGTPIRNHSDDLYTQYKFLGYRDQKFNSKEFKKMDLKRYLFFMTYQLAQIKLPTVNHERVPVILSDNNLKIYNHYLDKANEAFEDYTVGTKSFAEVLTLFLRLRQACISPWTITPQNIKKKEEIETYEISQYALDETTDGLASWINEYEGTAGLKAPKIQKTIELIKNVPKGQKVIVFTMFKRVIELLEIAMKVEKVNISFLSITGDIVGKERDKYLNSFKKGEVDVMFISYKIGAESLNLTEANNIILLEPWWCPAVINQAKARVNRLGQTKETNIYELYVKNDNDCISIEEAIIEIGDSKLKMIESFFDNEKSTTEPKLDANTLQKLLMRSHLKSRPLPQ